jgi:tRNA(Ile)-lysidine synthase
MEFDASPARRPRLTPPVADIRRAVRESLADYVLGATAPDSGVRDNSGGHAENGARVPDGRDLSGSDGDGVSPDPRDENDGDFAGRAGAAHAARGMPRENSVVLVGLSGGADSLALAAAVAFEAPRAGIRAGAVIVDHGLQIGSADVAAHAAAQARALGLDPVLVCRVTVPAPPAPPAPAAPAAPAAAPPEPAALDGGTRALDGGRDGPEGAARAARYGAFTDALAQTGASHLLLAHTLDDQAETVLLGLARGSGATSLHGMARASGPYLRPLLGIRRATTRQFCADSGLKPWDDPQNRDPRFARVRVRNTVLPTLESELGPGIAEALARTAELLREDDAALEQLVLETIEDICESAEAGIAVSVGALEANPPALRNRIIRYVVFSEFGVSLQRVHVEAVARLVTHWHGQKPLDLPGIRVARRDGMLVFRRNASA